MIGVFLLNLDNSELEKKMLNPYYTLKKAGYINRKDFLQILRWAGSGVKEFNNEDELLSAVTSKFGLPPLKQICLEEPKPYKVWASSSFGPDQEAIKQLEIALRLPVAIGGAVMPDMHIGYSLPIGGVVSLDNAISPAFVGYDISCMVMLTIFEPTEKFGAQALNDEEIRKQYLEWVLSSTSFGLGAASLGEEHPVLEDSLWKEIKYLKSIKSLAVNQIGSSGAGNHFADIVSGSYNDGSGDFVGLITHSGSRGAGNKVGHFYAQIAENETSPGFEFPSGYGWLGLETEEGQEYLHAMNLMGDYALANHQLIHARFANKSGLEPAVNVWNRHNFAWIQADGSVLHRKGATPAELGQIGIIPGTCGTDSFLVSGKGNIDSYQSASHGAGRITSRRLARKQFNPGTFNRYMHERAITHHGIAPDESVSAYKNINEVMDAQSDLVEIVATLRPRVVVMGGEILADDGD